VPLHHLNQWSSTCFTNLNIKLKLWSRKRDEPGEARTTIYQTKSEVDLYINNHTLAVHWRDRREERPFWAPRFGEFLSKVKRKPLLPASLVNFSLSAVHSLIIYLYIVETCILTDHHALSMGIDFKNWFHVFDKWLVSKNR